MSTYAEPREDTLSPQDTHPEAVAEHEPLSVLEIFLLQHLGLAKSIHDHIKEGAPSLEAINLSATKPNVTCKQVSEADPDESFGILNPNPVPVTLGWAGNRAANGQGITIPANAYLVLPFQTNAVDVAVNASAIAEEAQITVMVLHYRKPVKLSSGSIGATATSDFAGSIGENSSPAFALTGASQQILAANPGRTGGVIMNPIGNAEITIWPGATPVIAGKGITLEAGGSCPLDFGTGVLLTTAVQIIGTATQTVAVLEIV
jgi:hypothetical protein